MSETKKLDILNQILGDYYRSGKEYIFFCIKCKHHKKKLSINLEKDAFKCWICDFSGKSVRRIVLRYGNYTQQRSWAEISGNTDISEYENIFFSEDKQEIIDSTIPLPEEFQSLCVKNYNLSSLSPKRYLKDRGISKEDILFWKMGYANTGEYAGRVIIPSFNMEGKVNYFVARTFQNDWKRYMNPPAPKDIIFNELYIDWSSDITIVEGVFDAIKARNAIPLLGSTLREDSRLFKELIKNDPAIYIALDPDASKKAEKLITSLLSYDAEVYKIDIPDGKDVGDMSHETFLELKKHSSLIKDSDYLLMNKIMSL